MRSLLILPALLILALHVGAQAQGNAKGSKAALIQEAKVRLDAAVDAGLAKAGITYNVGLNDHMFVRRIYTDLAGRIPSYEETQAFVTSMKPDKRPALVDALLASGDFVSHSYNWFADLLRVQSMIPDTKLRTDVFSFWLKGQLRDNRPFDQIVREMVTADGRIWEDPAAAYHLRDNGAKLDHVSYMAKAFLGTDISCAQCHDAPFHDWTQYQYYELSAYLADLETRETLGRRPKRVKGKPQTNQKSFFLDRGKLSQYLAKTHKINTKTEDGDRALRRLTNRFNSAYRDMLRANELLVHSKKDAVLKLPDTYEYDNAKPGDAVEPRAIFGAEGRLRQSDTARQRLANWLVSRNNPRFAINLGNRLWAKHMGRGASEPLHDMKPPSECDNPELVRTLQSVVLALDYDLKAITRAIVSSKAYNALATTTTVESHLPYLFPGPVLRRMSAEQIWDSMLTLMIEDPFAYRRTSGRNYLDIINLVKTGPQSFEQYEKRIERYRSYRPNSELIDRQGKPVFATVKEKPKRGSDEMMEMMMMRDARRNKMVLARASELTQPAPQGHFLRDFGQSNRDFLVDAGTRTGSVPQVMELMNGAATTILTKPNSLIFQKMKDSKDPMARAEIVFLSILNRKMLPNERELIVGELKRGDGAFSDLIWALLNTPEFLFVK